WAVPGRAVDLAPDEGGRCLFLPHLVLPFRLGDDRRRGGSADRQVAGVSPRGRQTAGAGHGRPRSGTGSARPPSHRAVGALDRGRIGRERPRVPPVVHLRETGVSPRQRTTIVAITQIE